MLRCDLSTLFSFVCTVEAYAKHSSGTHLINKREFDLGAESFDQNKLRQRECRVVLELPFAYLAVNPPAVSVP